MTTYPITDEYDERGFAPPLTPGDYDIELVDVHETDKDDNPFKDKNGFEYISFEFSVVGYEENKLFDRICFDENNQYANLNLGKFKQMQIALGVDTSKEGDTSTLIGKQCRAFVKNKVVGDRTYNNIVEYKPREGQTEQPNRPMQAQLNQDDNDNLPF